MPTLLHLLDQYFFADFPGLQARAALVHAWEHASSLAWDQLYIQSLDDALVEELPHLSAYAESSAEYPTRAELAYKLATDLGEAGSALYTLDLNSGVFLSELARVMQMRQFFMINRQNLFTDEYRQIFLNLFDHAHSRFKSGITEHEPEFSAALASTTHYDLILLASIVNYLARQFGISMPSLPPTPPSPAQLPLAETILNMETLAKSSAELPPPRPVQNRLRILLAIPVELQNERTVLTKLVHELDAHARTRLGLELELVNPTATEIANVNSAVELADIFIGILWLRFGGAAIETDAAFGETFFVGDENDFTAALEQSRWRGTGWLRTVIYRSIRPPLDLLHFNLAEYTRVDQFIERASANSSEDFVRVFKDSAELVTDAQARLEAWIYNYASDLANALIEFGNSSAEVGQVSGALMDFEQALSLYRELDRPEQELALWLQVATLHRQVHDPTHAASALNAALTLAQRTQDDNSAAYALYQTGMLHTDSKDWQSAIQTFQKARANLKPDAALYREILSAEITAQENIGADLHAAGELEHATSAYRDALSLAQEIDDAARCAALWQKLGALAAERGAWNDALEAYAQAFSQPHAPASREIRRAILDAQAAAHQQLAQQARDTGDFESAENAYRAALAKIEQGSNVRAHRIEILAALGALAAARGLWERAIEANDRALAELDAPDVASEAGDGLQNAPLRATLLRDQAMAYQHVGDARLTEQDYEAAGSAYRDALVCYQDLNAQSEQAIVLNQLGAVCSAQARWQEANAFLVQALERLDSPDAHEMRAAAQHAQATALEHVGDEQRDAQAWEQAEIAYAHARDNLEQLGLGNETGALLTKLGTVTAAQERLEEALALFQQARARLTAPEQTPARAQAMYSEAITLGQMGEAQCEARDFVRAQATYRQQLDLAQELDAAALEADALHHLGLVTAAQANWDDTINFYEQALARLDDPAQDETRARIQEDLLVAYLSLGERERAAHQFPQAAMAYRAALTCAQVLSEREKEADVLYELGRVSMDQANWDEALVDLRRALGIYNLMPAAPNKPQVIWNIGRAQRGQKSKQLRDALQRADDSRNANDWTNAANEYHAALQGARDLGDAHTECIALHELGAAASAQSDWDTALAFYQAALALTDNGQMPELRAKILRAQQLAFRARGDSQRSSGDFENAEANYSAALAAALEQNDRDNASELYFSLGTLAADANAWEKALGNYALALEHSDAAHRAEIKTNQAVAFQNWGDLQRAAGQFDAANSAYTLALECADEVGDDERAANVLHRFGLLNATLGRWQQALDYCEQADARLPASESGARATLSNDKAVAVRALKQDQLDVQLAHAQSARQTSQWDDAATAYRAALALAQDLGDSASITSLRSELVSIYADQGAALHELELWEGANDAYRESWLLAREFQMQDQVQARQSELLAVNRDKTNALRTAGDIANAIRAAQDTYALAQEFGDSNTQADALYLLGLLAARQADWKTAKSHYEQARTLFVSAERSETLVQLDHDLAAANQMLDHPTQFADTHRG